MICPLQVIKGCWNEIFVETVVKIVTKQNYCKRKGKFKQKQMIKAINNNAKLYAGAFLSDGGLICFNNVLNSLVQFL